MEARTYKRTLWQRILGIPQSRRPADPECWQVDDGGLRVDLERAPELKEPFGALRIESKTLQTRVLLMRDGQGKYHAFRNKCSHGGRRLDPVPGTATVCCCSLGRSTFDYAGNRLSGSAKTAVEICPVEERDHWLRIRL